MRNLDKENTLSNSTSISRRDSSHKKSRRPKENKKIETSFFNEKEKKSDTEGFNGKKLPLAFSKEKSTRNLRGGENKTRKNSKLMRNKIKKIKKRTQKRDSNLYDINNFVVQNNSNKINEKKDYINIPIPVFKELQEDFYEIKEELNDLELNSDTIFNVVFNFKFTYLFLLG